MYIDIDIDIDIFTYIPIYIYIYIYAYMYPNIHYISEYLNLLVPLDVGLSL